ncbi:GT-D fold domain-containing glycosyltransferase [Photobacterium aphoticum]|uniref:GT-D fold domain-containing glycosyltransferase n=1 Tax=Photobacterium aphoticum TaxID=754436 RepID=UPI00069F2281|nr:GT-D fold domain-containing glycosyltransferase [Photobacterium aphoticum]PSU56682.1 DUF1792 domain-containing protein [Photobacterium aphoticum]GHA38945.1 glycosyl transferase [Photobacterium aphoticum]
MIKNIIKKIVPNKVLVLMKKSKRNLNNYIKSNEVNVTKEDLVRLHKYKECFPNVMTTKRTLDEIIYNRASICRYGDAEFDISNQENQNDSYQSPSNGLTRRLHEILQNGSCDKLLVCIPPFNSATNNIKRYHGCLSFWEWYWLNRFTKIKPFLINCEYGNSFVTRETVFHENQVDYIKKIWDKRDVVFVYSAKGRFNVNDLLFDNISSKSEVLVPPSNAFDEYDSILEECKKYPANSLFMIAAGPTATVLAYDLFKLGYQALDVGHLPNSYDEFKGVIMSPEDIPLIS